METAMTLAEIRENSIKQRSINIRQVEGGYVVEGQTLYMQGGQAVAKQDDTAISPATDLTANMVANYLEYGTWREPEYDDGAQEPLPFPALGEKTDYSGAVDRPYVPISGPGDTIPDTIPATPFVFNPTDNAQRVNNAPASI